MCICRIAGCLFNQFVNQFRGSKVGYRKKEEQRREEKEETEAVGCCPIWGRGDRRYSIMHESFYRVHIFTL